eukprot:7182415-Pyramimonas_sp.AAC.1
MFNSGSQAAGRRRSVASSAPSHGAAIHCLTVTASRHSQRQRTALPAWKFTRPRWRSQSAACHRSGRSAAFKQPFTVILPKRLVAWGI